MRWRFNKLNWSYACGELLIVVVGVLIALAVDQWNTARLERVEEVGIIRRLIADLNDDLFWLDFESTSLDQKEASLRRVRRISVTPDTRPEDPVTFLNDVIEGSNFGWHQVSGRRTTYDEALTSGSFSLIEDAELRFAIAEYYDALEDRFRRIDERETEFPSLSYRLVPRQNEGSDNGAFGLETEVRLDPTLGDTEIERLVTRVLTSDIHDHIDAEINLAQFVRNTGNGLRRDCERLIRQLEAYLLLR